MLSDSLTLSKSGPYGACVLGPIPQRDRLCVGLLPKLRNGLKALVCLKEQDQ